MRNEMIPPVVKEIFYTIVCILLVCAALFLPWYVMFNVSTTGDQILWLFVTVFIVARGGRYLIDRMG